MMLETERLILREMCMSDLAAMYAVLGDSDIMRHYPYTFDEERVRGWIEKNIRRYEIFGFGLWAVVLKESWEVIGDCGVTMQCINGIIRPEIGYHIAKRSQRQGYAREAARRCRDWAFENTPFNILYSYMKKDNIPSAAVARANGMRLIEEFTDGENEVTAVYGVTRGEWKQIERK
ncbi:MAG: GNAT family N-acetyltransferase [Huintestinicola sp.]|uniref:GNAT family N-acetyltransferase n=1 Tax=Huintestinicola sp. TaxID=2981661 RepID=UPI003F019226